MTREQIIAITKAGARRSVSEGFAVSPIQPRHLARLAELKRRAEIDKEHNDHALSGPIRLTA
jgi:hypothetical protein